MARRRRHEAGRAWLALAVGALLVLGASCGGLMSLSMVLQSVEGFALAITAATAVAVPYALVLIWLDRNEREPPVTIAFALAWGALVATAFAGVFNDLFQAVAEGATGSPQAAAALTASFSAPLVEESFKGVAVGVLWILFWDELDDVLDGLIYGALVGLGFAWFENVVYYTRAFDAGGGGALAMTVFVRGFVMAGLGSHMAYTAWTGIGFGIARVLRRGALRWLFVPAGWVLAMAGHFAWNGALAFAAPLADAAGGVGWFLLLIGGQVPFAGLAVGVGLLAWRHQDRLIRRYLAEEPEWVTQAELARLVPARRRTVHGLMRLLRGPESWWRGRRLDHAQIELAFARWHHERDAPGWSADEDDDVRAARARVARARQPTSSSRSAG